jgi:sugar/nucleoside kinase (ribokinase family)
MIEVWPSQDTLANILTQTDGNGGGPYNLTKNLAKLRCGFPLAGVGLIGHDADGETILRDCATHGISRRAIQQTTAAPTSYTDVMTVISSGRRTFFHQQGANRLLNSIQFDLVKSSAQIFYLGYLGLLHTLDMVDDQGRTEASRLFEQARSLGLTTVADLVSNETGNFATIVNPSLPHLDYLLLNEYELARLAGVEVSRQPVQLEAQAREILQRGVHRAVIVHLPEGALYVTSKCEVVWQPAVKMPAHLIGGTAGAGDAFGAGFLFGLHEGWEVSRCLELAVCVAAASLRDATCSTTIEPWEKCLVLGREMGFHTGIQIK